MTRKRILFIDGDEGFVREVADAAEQRGFETVVTGSSTDGFELARSHRPDLIVVNVELMPTNGWSVCTKLKKDDELKDIPVVLTSSTSTEDTFEKHKKLKTRADEYLLKPYSGDQLVAVAGQLVGLPELAYDALGDAELSVADEALVVEDESLSLGEFDSGVLEETITVAEDEPLNLVTEAEGESEVLPFAEETVGEFSAEADGAFDPLATISAGEESVIADEAELAAASLTSPGEGEAAFDELAAFDESFASLTPPPQAPADAEMAIADPLAGEENAFADIEGATAIDMDGLVTGEALTEVDPLAAVGGASAFDTEGLAFDEAPLEVPDDDVTTVSEPQFDSADGARTELSGSAYSEANTFGTEGLEASSESGLSAMGAFDDSPRTIELEARVAELEAELEGYRTTESSRDLEIERLRHELSERERTIGELRENESRLQAEAAKARDEKARREATMKALTAKAEQMAAAGKKLERDLLAAREEVKHGQALKAKVAELEHAKKEAEQTRAELAALQDQLGQLQLELEQTRADLADARQQDEELRNQLAASQGELEQSRGEADGLRTDLEEARATAEKALANAGQLQERVASAEQRARDAEESLKRIRGQLMGMLEEMGGATTESAAA